jgi:hypothetical protein
MGAFLSFIDSWLVILDLADTEFEQRGSRLCTAISLSGRGILGHEAAPQLLGLAVLARAAPHDGANQG